MARDLRNAIPPPYFITADDKRGLIIVTVAVVLAFVWTCSFIRIWLRWQSKSWKSDDWLLAAATLLHTAQSGVVVHLVNLGLGTSQKGVPPTQLQRLGKEGIASQIFYICTLTFSKCSVLCLYLRLSPDGAHKTASYTGLMMSTAWAVMAIVLIVVPCNPAQYYTSPGSCKNRWAKWQAIGALDIATEVCIFGIALQMVWNLQMRSKSKFLVIFAFSARLPVIAIAAVRLHYLHERFLGRSDTFEYLVATQWQMGYAIMASTITGLGPFLRPFNKEYTTSYHQKSNYESGRSDMADHSQNARLTGSQPRGSWNSEGYLMQPVISRRGTRTTGEGPTRPFMLGDSSSTHRSTASDSSTHKAYRDSSTPQTPNLLTADANFRPFDNLSRNDTEIWVGDRTASFGAEADMPTHMGENKTLIINKRTQFKVEVDRASQVL